MSKYDKKAWQQKKQDDLKQTEETILQIAKSFRESPENIAELLAFKTNFYQYSLRNTMLIYAANPHAIFTASFKAFKDMGWSVKKGETGIPILVPVQVTYLKKSDDEWVQLSFADESLKSAYNRGEIESRSVQRFKIGHVFDISQTNCPQDQFPKIFNMGSSSEEHKAAFEGMKEYVKTRLNCPVFIVDMKSIALRGEFVMNELGEKKILLSDKLNDTQLLSTGLHELAHAVLHSSPEALHIPNMQKEFEADALSIMLQTHMGFELTDVRKSHLASSYRELIADVQENISIEKILGQVSDIYKDLIEDFDLVVRQHLEISTSNSIQEDQNNALTEKELSFSEQIDAALSGNLNQRNALKVCDTPKLLQKLGCQPLPMLFTQRHLIDCLHEKSPDNPRWHGLLREEIENLPSLIENPAMVIDSPSREDSIVLILSAVDQNKLPLILSIRPNGQGQYEFQKIDSNFITSIYGKDNFEYYISTVIPQENFLFIDKKRSQELERMSQLQLLRGLSILDCDTILHQSNHIVNTYSTQETQNYDFIALIAKPVLDGTYDRMIFYHSEMDSIEVSRDGDKLTIAQIFKCGDHVLYCPKIEFTVDDTNHALRPLSYEHSERKESHTDITEAFRERLNRFCQEKWFPMLQQGYSPMIAIKNEQSFKLQQDGSIASKELSVLQKSEIEMKGM